MSDKLFGAFVFAKYGAGTIYTRIGNETVEIDGIVLPDHDRDDLLAEFDAWEPSFDLVAYAAQARWEKEVGGVEVGGMAVHTDDRSKALIMGARLAATLDPDFETEFKTAAGSFVTVAAPTIIAISDAVLAHVAACFATEAQVLAQIDAGTITDAGGIDAAFA